VTPPSTLRPAARLGELRTPPSPPALDPVGEAPLGALPINVAPRRPRPLRVIPGHQERLRQAKFDLCARWHVETNEDLILGQFIDECFETWLRSKLEPKS